MDDKVKYGERVNKDRYDTHPIYQGQEAAYIASIEEISLEEWSIIEGDVEAV